MGIMIADKLYSDEYMTNIDYAAIGGLPVKELNVLEHEFLVMIGYDLYISEERYQGYYQKLAGFWTSLRVLKEVETNEKEKCQDRAVSETEQNTDAEAPMLEEERDENVC